jgi:hypothetical protein
MSQKGIGRQVQVGVSRESTRGTSPATASFYISWADLAFEEKYDNVVDVESYGVMEDSASETRVKDYAQGVLKMPLLDKTFPLFLYSLLGTDAPTVHAGGTLSYDHALTVKQNSQHQSFTLYIHDPLAAQDYTHANCVVEKVEIDYAVKKFVDASISIKGLKGVQVGTLSPSQTAENRFVPQYLVFKMASALSGLGGAAATQVKSLKLTIDQNIEDDEVLGQKAPRDFLTKEFKVEGTVELIFNGESDFKTNALANTPQAMRLDLINTDVTLEGAINPEIRIDLAKAFFTEFSLPRKLKDLVYQTVKFKAVYSISDAQMIAIRATNLVAAY